MLLDNTRQLFMMIRESTVISPKTHDAFSVETLCQKLAAIRFVLISVISLPHIAIGLIHNA